MTPQQARDIAQILINAADAADIAGNDQVVILPYLRALDDDARDELDAAIKAASKPAR
jgi:hypothetical protein